MASNEWPTCRECKFWEAGADKTGLCHKNAPKPHPAPIENAEGIVILFPITYEDDWCAEFVKFTGEW